MKYRDQARAALVEYFAMRPRCRCGVPLDYACDDTHCAQCSREMSQGDEATWLKRKASRRSKVAHIIANRERRRRSA